MSCLLALGYRTLRFSVDLCWITGNQYFLNVVMIITITSIITTMRLIIIVMMLVFIVIVIELY